VVKKAVPTMGKKVDLITTFESDVFDFISIQLEKIAECLDERQLL